MTEEPIEYDVDREGVLEDLRDYNNDLILTRTAVSHIDGDLKMKIETARILINDVVDQISESLEQKNAEGENQ